MVEMKGSFRKGVSWRRGTGYGPWRESCHAMAMLTIISSQNSVWDNLALLVFGLTGATAAKSFQSCLSLCDPIDSSTPGSLAPGILQARTLESGAISFSNAWKWKVKVKSLSRVRLLATPWTATYQVPPSMRFSRQEYWSGVPLPSLIRHCRAYQNPFIFGFNWPI